MGGSLPARALPPMVYMTKQAKERGLPGPANRE